MGGVGDQHPLKFKTPSVDSGKLGGAACPLFPIIPNSQENSTGGQCTDEEAFSSIAVSHPHRWIFICGVLGLSRGTRSMGTQTLTKKLVS